MSLIYLFLVLQTSEHNRKCLTKIVAVYVEKLYNVDIKKLNLLGKLEHKRQNVLCG